MAESPDGVKVDHEPVETAWKIHAALVDWIGKVDSKASFALTIESAMMAGVITFDPNDLESGYSLVPFWLGVAALACALVACAWVVMPRIREKDIEKEWGVNTIFFGHLKFWKDHESLQESLRTQDILPMLARQLEVMSGIAWMKHILLRRSLTGALVAGLLFAVSALLDGVLA